MGKINIGVAKLIVSNQLKESYFNGSLLSETKQKTTKFFDIVKQSPLLQQEMKIFENLEKKYSTNDLLATRYIDNNVNLLETYTLEELQKEHDKLKPFMVDVEIDSKKQQLYESISTLIEESLKPCEDVDVDRVHESFENVLSHIKSNKPEKNISLPDNINEEVIEIAINKFNEKYQNMTSEEVDLFKKLVNSDDTGKKKLFETYKRDNISILENLMEENHNDKISKSLEKINEMVFNPTTVDSDIVRLFELKKGLK